MSWRWWLEIGPLREGNYTGISHVTAELAACMLGDGARDCAFFFGNTAVAPAVVEGMLRQRHGELLEWHVARSGAPPAPDDPALRHAAIFPNRKTIRRGFDIEAQVVHDLTTLLTPQFHNDDNVNYHALSLRDDIYSNDVTFCVSEATRGDVLAYLGPLDPARVVTTLIAGAPLAELPPLVAAEPYVLVLGTLEPRKNIEQVLGFIAEQPHILRSLRFVFPGRYGWGESADELLGRHGLRAARTAGRIVFPGFVSEAAKNALLRNARMLIYPSLFEGFGLPVLEALQMGTPCLTTHSSSLPEVGGDWCSYFDPTVAGDFARGFSAALQDSPALRDGRQRWAAGFGWDRTWRAMTESLQACMDRHDG